MRKEEVVSKECNAYDDESGIVTNEVGALNRNDAILGRPTTKVRKAYKVSKQRQKWSDEEHRKFLEGLKLHGRAWRLIQDYIGTKNTVQIRSHAQKFFSKVEKGEEEGGHESIEIPPPRPKRKPNHPYPRKETTPPKSLKLGTKITSTPCQNPLLQDATQGMEYTTVALTSPHKNNIGSENAYCVMQQPSRYTLPCLKLFGQIIQIGSALEPNNLDHANSMSICSWSKTKSLSYLGLEEAQLKHPSSSSPSSSSSSSSPDVDVVAPHCAYNQHVGTMCPHDPQVAVNATPLLFNSESCFKPWHPKNSQIVFHSN